ncbi:MAG: sensor histidine kinase, partial [Mucilaginibacter sp.]
DMAAMELVDIDELINHVEWSLEDKIAASGAVITRDLGVKKILFSKKNLRSIVFNLISNAIKFKREIPPLIHICTSLQNGRIILSVADNGKGIAEKSRVKIFDMYGRLNQDIEGSGIGLYLAQKIVHAADGLLEVESTVGQGSLFRIVLKDNPVAVNVIS